MKKTAFIVGFGIASWIGPAAANETMTYTYDAQGRMVTVLHTGTVNNNVQASYSQDNADNRTNVTVTGSPNPPPP